MPCPDWTAASPYKVQSFDQNLLIILSNQLPKKELFGWAWLNFTLELWSHQKIDILTALTMEALVLFEFKIISLQKIFLCLSITVACEPTHPKFPFLGRPLFWLQFIAYDLIVSNIWRVNEIWQINFPLIDPRNGHIYIERSQLNSRFDWLHSECSFMHM
jgi:hypothetical protein